MLRYKSDGVHGGEISQSKLTGSISGENRGNPDENSSFSEKGLTFLGNSETVLESKITKLATSQELTLSYLCESSKLDQNTLNSLDKVRGKLVSSEDQDQKRDENRWVERDFLQLSGSSSKREVEDDETHFTSQEKKSNLETLDLSLTFSGASLSMTASNRVQQGDHSVSLNPSRSWQSLARSNSYNTQTTFSDDFTAASHNPSCSMTWNSSDRFEHSMGSHNQMWNGGEGTNGSVHSRFRPAGDGGVSLVQPNRTNSDSNLSLFPSDLPARPKMDTHSGDSKGSHGVDSTRSHKPSRPERILWDIVSESIPIMAQMVQEFTDETIESAKDHLRKAITVSEKRDEFARLQLRLERRSDLTSETLSKASRNQLQILVSIRTGLESFLSAQTRLPPHELIEIFSFERCKNVNCRRPLPVEDCDCKICSTKKGFCSECMCPVCLEFDGASNTCSWVGCDVCGHWCHAACGIQKGLIRPTGTTEVQFRCLGCGHSSEMYGFVKDVFKSCAEQWSAATLVKELGWVMKIFRGSGDFKGTKLRLTAGEMISILEKKGMSPADVCNSIFRFFDYADGLPELPTSNVPSKDPTPSKPQPPQTSTSAQPDIADECSVKSTKKDRFESVESLVRVKEAEARMFQNKADDARREAEGYQRMIRVKVEKLDGDYSERIAKLRLRESEDTRKHKFEEFKVSENARCEYYKMKMRMQAEISGLLERMNNAKQQWV